MLIRFLNFHTVMTHWNSGREPNLEESEVAQLIRQSLEADHSRLICASEGEESQPEEGEPPSARSMDEAEIRVGDLLFEKP